MTQKKTLENSLPRSGKLSEMKGKHMESWEKRQRHTEDVRAAGSQGGTVITKTGFCRKYDGKSYWQFLNKKGHNHTQFDKCSCNK